MKKITHKHLCIKAGNWLKRHLPPKTIDSLGKRIDKPSFGVVVIEKVNSSGEWPDAIGIMSNFSMLIECKLTRSDFLNDKEKIFRRDPKRGLGSQRYYLTLPGIIKIDDLPDCWGLLYLNGRSIEIIKCAVSQDSSKTALNCLLYSYCLELQNGK